MSTWSFFRGSSAVLALILQIIPWKEAFFDIDIVQLEVLLHTWIVELHLQLATSCWINDLVVIGIRINYG